MKLLKVGFLDLEGYRWKDALRVFDELHVLQLYRDGEDIIVHPDVHYHFFPSTFFNRFMLLGYFKSLLMLFNTSRIPKPILSIMKKLFTIKNQNTLREISDIGFDDVHISYNDYDESGILALLLKDKFEGKRITRAYKETRIKKDPIEYESFLMADRVVLNNDKNIEFFQKKYGDSIFDGKEVITGIDEDYLPELVLKEVAPNVEKLSEHDGRKHVVILAGRVMSDYEDERSGSRLCYIDLIKDFLSNEFAVHLHALRINKDKNGIDQYEVLKKQYPDSFFVEPPIDFSEKNTSKAYRLLSRYDYGIMHNFVEGTTNTEFDKYNIPHRFYKYCGAGVTPVLEKGKTIVLENLLNDTNSGFIYTDISELKQERETKPYTPSFKDYIETLYADS